MRSLKQYDFLRIPSGQMKCSTRAIHSPLKLLERARVVLLLLSLFTHECDLPSC